MDILAFIQSVIDLEEVKIMTALLMANFFSGMLAGVMTGTFNFSMLKDIWKRTGVIFGAYLVIAVLAYFVPQWEVIRTVTMGFLSAFLVEKILVSLKAMGIPVPDQLTKLPVVSLLNKMPALTKKPK